MVQANQKSITLPLLFWKPGLATVPVLELSFSPEGDRTPIDSVRKPFEVLDASEPPLEVPILKRLLPRFTRLGYYPCVYRFPPRDVDQFVDEFPRGLSHLLLVTLGFYALGADHVLGGTAFRSRLAGWTATGYPDKSGTLRAAVAIEEKLRALSEENPELQSMGCPEVHRVLIPAENAAKLPAAWGRPDSTGRLDYHDEHGKLELHIVSTFEETLGQVFGTELVRRYRRATVLRQVLRYRLFWTAAVLLVVALAACLFGPTQATILHVLHQPDKHSEPPDAKLLKFIRHPDDPDRTMALAFYSDGRQVPIGPFTGLVNDVATTRDQDGAIRKIYLAVGGRLANQPISRHPGTVHCFEVEDSGALSERWCTQPGHGVRSIDPTAGDGPSGGELKLAAVKVVLGDLLPARSGQELAVLLTTDTYPTLLALLDATHGREISRLWHCGSLGQMILVSDPPRLVIHGAANRLTTRTQKPDQHIVDAHEDRDAAKLDDLDRVVFSIEPRNIRGRGPIAAPGNGIEPASDMPIDRSTPIARFDWYVRIVPKGPWPRIVLDPWATQKPSRDAVCINLECWTLWLDRNGKVADIGKATGATTPEPGVEDVPMY